MKLIDVYGTKGGVGTTTTTVALSKKFAEIAEDKIIGITTSSKDKFSVEDMHGITGFRFDDYKIEENLILYPVDIDVDYLIIDNGFANPDSVYTADYNIFVVENSYLSLKRSVMLDLNLSTDTENMWIKILNPHAALNSDDIDNVLSLKDNVKCGIPVDAKIARAVDAGVLCRRLPIEFSNLSYIVDNILKKENNNG